MSLRSLLLCASSALLLTGCATMDGLPQPTTPVPPPAHTTYLLQEAPKAKAVKPAKKEVTPLPVPKPVQPAPAPEAPPHKWYDHLKFWKN